MTGAPLAYGKPADDREVADYHRILTQAFGLPPDAERNPALEEGLANLRVVRRTGRVVGGLALQPCGQVFGGRVVPVGAVRAVGVAPDARGTGVATHLMRESLREHRERGWAVSTLFPSTRGLYRKTGYEVAGAHPIWRLPLAGPAGPEPGLTLRPLDLGDAAAMAAMRRLYDAQARATNGWLDRSDWFWARVFRQRPGEGAGNLVYAYLIEGAGGPEGYVIYTQPTSGPRRYRLKVRDWVASTPAARRRLWAFLAGHGTLADLAELPAGPADPLIVAGEEPAPTPSRDHPWMLRVVDVQVALEARGWPAGLATELSLAVRDPLFAENCEPMVVTIDAGRAAVRTGGDARVTMDVAGLAPLFTGYLDPFALRAMGLLEGADADLAIVRTAFAGPPPWLPELF